MKEAGLGRGMGMFATRRVLAGQVMWTEHPLISYKKRAADEHLEAYVDSLHQVFCQLNETAQAKLLDMYGPEEEPGRQGIKWKLFRWIFNHKPPKAHRGRCLYLADKTSPNTAG